MRWTAAAAVLLLCSAVPCNSEEEEPAGELCIYSARCITNSPRLIKVQHSPQSQSYSYFYQVPRRIRKVVRRKLVRADAPKPAAATTTAAPPLADDDDDAVDDDPAALFDHIQLTPVFGRRLSARRSNDTEAATTAAPPPVETEASPNRLGAGRRRRPARRRLRPQRPAAADDSDELSQRANTLEAASRHGSTTSGERAFRVQRLKRRRKIMAKKLVRKQFLAPSEATPRKKILKVVAVRKRPRVIPGLSEVYHDNLINSLISEEYPTLQPSPGIKGFPGVDYPIYQSIPETTFQCSQQRYWGMYADTAAQCQVWHYCDQDGHKHSFLCPNGTVFSQVTFICDWWFNVDCNNAVQLYVTNEALSLLPAPPEKTFPEDFKGPIVDWYIYQRHQERAYRKEKFLRELEQGRQLKAIKFLETHDFPPWFTERDQALYLKLKALERKSKHNEQPSHRPVKKELTQYAPW
ncbi:uncharacterized protein LOC119103798 [Pollicipes pollicipes]|uniref:uncharacterized protein LOC119103798 n=1 Tax=Pollicipes pollicipes TaxID=41117 RepID=UPI0018859B4A|nr:uncharacterized protein LOC119103798 [Pollicipes pollicipes]